MNRKHKRSLILFPLSLGVVGLFAGREMASWRPVKQGQSIDNAYYMDAAQAWVLAATDSNSSNMGCSLLNLRTHKASLEIHEEGKPVGVEGDFFWCLNPHRTAGGNTTRLTLTLRNTYGHEQSFSWKPSDDFDVSPVKPVVVHLCLESNEIELLCKQQVLRWSLSTGRLQKSVALSFIGVSDGGDGIANSCSFSRDGETVVLAGWGGIYFFSTRDGQLKRSIPFLGFHGYEYRFLSHSGSYALYDAPGLKAPSTRWRLIDTQAGRIKWSFESDLPSDVPVMSADEKLIFFPLSSRRCWEVRDLATGRTLRQLPFLPNSSVAAPSPDGATLYSVAGGVLYRQRAR